jgi:hypothetical protein
VGERGEPGLVGPPGEMGPVGPIGPQGLRGEQGLQGTSGSRGERGERGEPGEKGDSGHSGADGLNGKDGPIGPPGKDGLSAYEIAKQSGYTGSLADWFLTLAGRDGKDGAKGEPGRDALEIEVGDGIDLDRCYARGEYRTFDGGTFRANRRTDPLRGRTPADAGWSTIARGVKSISEEAEDGGRVLVKRVTYSDGETTEVRTRTAAMIYRGVWSETKGYLPGDTVTCDGSQWTCIRETQAKPPGDAWKLSVKAMVREARS